MDFYSKIGTPRGQKVFHILSRLMPRWLAYGIINLATPRLAKDRTNSTIQAIRSNQAVVRNLASDDPALDPIILKVLRNAAYYHFDLFKAMAYGPKAIAKAGVMDQTFLDGITAGVARGKGLIIAGAHMSSFDMLLFTLSQRNINAQVLSYRDPEEGYQFQNELRIKYGLDLTPVSVKALRKAIHRLREGGIVGTGVDRPGLGGESLMLFGKEAILPNGHARLAVQTGAAIMAGVVRKERDKKYHAYGSPLFEPPQTGDDQRDSHEMAQAVLSWIEERIREKPEEWMMFYPVWDEDN